MNSEYDKSVVLNEKELKSVKQMFDLIKDFSVELQISKMRTAIKNLIKTKPLIIIKGSIDSLQIQTTQYMYKNLLQIDKCLILEKETDEMLHHEKN